MGEPPHTLINKFPSTTEPSPPFIELARAVAGKKMDGVAYLDLAPGYATVPGISSMLSSHPDSSSSFLLVCGSRG